MLKSMIDINQRVARMLMAIVLLGLNASRAIAVDQPARQTLSFNQGWRFFRVDDPAAPPLDIATIKDGDWEKVNLPHTVRLEPANASGGKNFQGVCWYTRHFQPVDAWKNHTLYLRFEGAMSVADVWLNGQKLTTHFNGYQPFTIDISKSVKFDTENVLAVRLDNSDNKEVPPGKPQNQLDFCYFGGLYRDVDLIVMNPLHVTDEILANKVAGGGIFVSYPSVTDASATVQVQADVINDSDQPHTAQVRETLVDTAGKTVATSSANVPLTPGGSNFATQKLTVDNPALWHPDHPTLYKLITDVMEDGHVTDTVETRIGIREIRMTVADGLLINGKKFVSIGANRHQDHPYVGYAIPASGQWRDAKLLRETGFTSFRSHYPQDRAFLDACDEFGILVIESNPGWQIGGDELFTQRVQQNAREMIRRDRNRPSVFLWEAELNETYAYDRKIYPLIQKLVHEEDPFDGCYTAGDSVRKKADDPDWDVVYNTGVKDKPRWQREYGDGPVDNWTDQQSASRVAAGGGKHPCSCRRGNTLTSSTQFSAIRNSPALGGVDIWAGVDAYRGYHHQPFLGGPIDLFRLPKFDAFFFQSQRAPDLHVPGLTDGPMVFIANFATMQSPSTVTVFSNCPEVRLTQNGKEVATQKPAGNLAGLVHPPFTFKIGKDMGEAPRCS